MARENKRKNRFGRYKTMKTPLTCRCWWCTNPNYSWSHHQPIRGTVEDFENSFSIVWFENPKCASTSIKSVFPSRPMSKRQRTRLADENFRKKYEANFYYFGFVRNPYDKFNSNYEHFKKVSLEIKKGIRLEEPEESWGLKNIESISGMSQEEFFNYTLENPQHHWFPQNWFIPEYCNFYKIEQFDDAIKSLKKKEVKLHTDIPKLNKSKNKSGISEDLKEKIFKVYWKDFERFGYDK